MNNDTTNISEEERKLMENKTNYTTDDIKLMYPEIKQEPSPFKTYEEKYCNRCADYRGCLGLIDSMSMTLQDNKRSGSEALDNMVKSFGNMTFTHRFKLILDCMNMRKHLEMCGTKSAHTIFMRKV